MWFNPATGALEPLLAESYSISADGLVYTYNLRRGITFHDGAPLTAEAVVRSFDRVLNHVVPEDPEARSLTPPPGAFLIEMITDVRAVDNYTVEIELEFPFAPFNAHITHQVAYIISPLAMDEEQRYLDGDDARPVTANPVGTGPFVFAYRVHGDYTRLTPNTNHWRSVPAHDVVFTVIPEPATRIAMLETGAGNAMTALASDIHHLRSPMMSHVTHWLIPTTSLTYVGFNTQRGPLQDIRVRQAISMAINREDILYGVQEGLGVLAVGPIRGGSVAHAPTDVEAWPNDIEAARALLAETPYADGFTINFWFNEGNAVRARIAELIQDNLRPLNINVEISAIEWGAYLEDTAEGLHDMFILGWVTMTGDADYGIEPLFHSARVGNPGNRSFYVNPQVDELLERGRMSQDPSERDQIYREVTEILVYEAPMLFLFHPDTPAVTYGIDGFMFDFAVTPHFFNTTLR